MNKPWPIDDEPAEFPSIVDPLVAAMRHCYVLHRRNREQDVPWDGLDIGDREALCCFRPDHQLTADSLAYAESDQGYHAVDEIFGLAVRLGMEQGRRREREMDGEICITVTKLKALMATLDGRAP